MKKIAFIKAEIECESQKHLELTVLIGQRSWKIAVMSSDSITMFLARANSIQINDYNFPLHQYGGVKFSISFYSKIILDGERDPRNNCYVFLYPLSKSSISLPLWQNFTWSALAN